VKIDQVGLNVALEESGNKRDVHMDMRLKKAAQDFEALFIDNVFKSMRKTIPEGGLTEKAPGSEIYTEMFDTEVASHLARSKGMGLSELLYRQLGGGDFVKKVK